MIPFTRTIVSHITTTICPKERRRYSEIQFESHPSAFCCYCGQQWPQPIEVESSDDEASSRTTSISQTYGPLPSLSSSSSTRPPRHQRDRTSNFQKRFKAATNSALKEFRPPKDIDPYSHPLGLPIRLVTLLVIGERKSTFFIPRKTEKLGIIDLNPLPFQDILSLDETMTEEQWVEIYVRPNYEEYFAKQPQWKLGRSWSKEGGVHYLPKPTNGQARTISDLFNKPDDEFGHGITWEIQDGRIVVYFTFQDESGQTRTDKKKTKRALPTKAKAVKVKQEVFPIDPAGFDSSPPPMTRMDETPMKEERFDMIDTGAFESTSQLDKASDVFDEDDDDDEPLIHRTRTPSIQPPKRSRPQSQALDDLDQGPPRKIKRTMGKATRTKASSIIAQIDIQGERIREEDALDETPEPGPAMRTRHIQKRRPARK